MKFIFNLTFAILISSQASRAQEGIDPTVTYQKSDAAAEGVVRVEMGFEEYTKQTGENNIKYWDVVLLGLDGIRWASLTDKTTSGVLKQLKSEQEFEKFYCGLIKKAEAPCENRTYLKPKGPIAVLSDSREVAKRNKESADEIENVTSKVQSAIKLLLNIEWKKLPELKVDSPFESYVALLKNLREKAIRLKFELDGVGYVADSKIQEALREIEALESKDLEKLGKRLGLDLKQATSQRKGGTLEIMNIESVPSGLQNVLNKYLKDYSMKPTGIAYVGPGGYKIAGEYENFLIWEVTDDSAVVLTGLFFQKEGGFKSVSKETIRISKNSSELMIFGQINPLGDDCLSFGVSQNWINLGVEKNFDRKFLDSIRTRLKDAIGTAGLSVTVKRPNQRDSWSY